MANQLNEVDIIDIADDIEIVNIADDEQIVDIVDDTEIVDIADDIEIVNIADDKEDIDIAGSDYENSNDEDMVVDDFENSYEDDEDSLVSDVSDSTSYSIDFVDRVEKFVSHEDFLKLNERSEHCAIFFFYSTGGALALCAECMIDMWDIREGMSAVREHQTDRLENLDHRACSNCRQSMYVIIPRNMCPVCSL